MFNLFVPKKNPSRYPSLDHKFQIFDLLQLSRKENDCKQTCLATIEKYDQWKRSHKKSDVPSLFTYLHVEGRLLRRQAQDAVLLYRLIRKDRVRAFDAYTKNLPTRQVFGRVA